MFDLSACCKNTSAPAGDQDLVDAVSRITRLLAQIELGLRLVVTVEVAERVTEQGRRRRQERPLAEVLKLVDARPQPLGCPGRLSDPELRALALRAVERVAQSSELRDLGDDDARIEDARSRLR